MFVIGIFFFVYAAWAQGVSKLAAEARERELRDEKASVSTP